MCNISVHRYNIQSPDFFFSVWLEGREWLRGKKSQCFFSHFQQWVQRRAAGKSIFWDGFLSCFQFSFHWTALQTSAGPQPQPHSLQYISCTLDCTQRKTVGCQVGDYFHHGKKRLYFWSFCTKIPLGKFSVTPSSGQRLISAEYQVVALQVMNIPLSREIFLYIWFGNLCEILGQDGWGLIAWYSPIPVSFISVFALATVDKKVSFNWHALGGGCWFSDVITSKCRHLHSQLLTSYLSFFLLGRFYYRGRWYKMISNEGIEWMWDIPQS
jgi:hypothetical protein